MVKRFLVFLRHIFNLDEDRAEEQEITENVHKGVEFRGTNLWVLIFAVFIASIGLNVNSTAVVIGAMLISPLMGPIIGVGFGVGTLDFDLIKRALKNLAIAVVISLITSTFYFSLSPLADAQSELLARTSPTIWDVLIALFGGLAGIVGATRTEKSNVVPGVAIATALMPPLCTAGYGLASGQWVYFLGAFYLFFINSVFICFATFIIVRFLKIPAKQWVDQKRATKVRRYVWMVAVFTAIPSIWLGYRIVQRSIFTNNAVKFIQQELVFDNTQVISRHVDANEKKIEVLLLGESVDSVLLMAVKRKLPDYGLTDATLNIRQGLNDPSKTDLTAFRSSILEDLYRNNTLLLENKDKQIAFLQQELIKSRSAQFPLQDLSREVQSFQPAITEFGLAKMGMVNVAAKKQDTVVMAVLKTKRNLSREDQERLKNWVKARTNFKEVRLIIER